MRRAASNSEPEAEVGACYNSRKPPHDGPTAVQYRQCLRVAGTRRIDNSIGYKNVSGITAIHLLSETGGTGQGRVRVMYRDLTCKLAITAVATLCKCTLADSCSCFSLRPACV